MEHVTSVKQESVNDEKKLFGVTETLWLSNCSVGARHRHNNKSSGLHRQSNAKSHSTGSSSSSNNNNNNNNNSCMQLVPVTSPTALFETSDRLHSAPNVTHVIYLQRCVRQVATCLTLIINAVHDGIDSLGGDTLILRSACQLVSDVVLPRLVEAVTETITRPHSRVAQSQLTSAALNALEPCVQLVFNVRQTLYVLDDVRLVSVLTSLSLAAAESLQRMRRSAQNANDLAFTLTPLHDVISYDVMPASLSTMSDDTDWLMAQRQMRREDVAGQEVAQYQYFDQQSLAAVETCDAAYRQIQQCGTYLNHTYCWLFSDSDQFAQCLRNIIHNCYALGNHITSISSNAKSGSMNEFTKSVRGFANCISHIIITVPQVSNGGSSLITIGRAIRLCASSLLATARWMASERQLSTPYRHYAAHSRALSRALTHLVYLLSTNYLDENNDVTRFT